MKLSSYTMLDYALLLILFSLELTKSSKDMFLQVHLPFGLETSYSSTLPIGGLAGILLNQSEKKRNARIKLCNSTPSLIGDVLFY